MSRTAIERSGWVIWSDCQITRRKRFHLLCDPRGRQVFKSFLLGDILEQLVLREIFCYEHRVDGDDDLSVMCSIATDEE